MNIALYTLTSSLHDKSAVDAVTLEFLSSIETVLGYGFDFRGDDFSSYGKSDLDVIFIRTGGSEGLFRKVFPTLSGNILLLTSGKSNSLAASLEILSFLNQNGRKGEVLHGSAQYIAGRIDTLAKVTRARRSLDGQKLGEYKLTSPHYVDRLSFKTVFIRMICSICKEKQSVSVN